MCILFLQDVCLGGDWTWLVLRAARLPVGTGKPDRTKGFRSVYIRLKTLIVGFNPQVFQNFGFWSVWSKFLGLNRPKYIYIFNYFLTCNLHITYDHWPYKFLLDDINFFLSFFFIFNIIMKTTNLYGWVWIISMFNCSFLF